MRKATDKFHLHMKNGLQALRAKLVQLVRKVLKAKLVQPVHKAHKAKLVNLHIKLG